MPIEVATDLDYLIPVLRLRIGDTDSTAYRYLDSWLRVSLVEALKILGRWWGTKYSIDETTYIVSRDPDLTYDIDEPPTIQQMDDMPIVLMAAIITKEGSLENSSWSTGSWRDAEVSVSNIEGSKTREGLLLRLWDELNLYLTPPSKRLMGVFRSSIPGAEEYQD